jgi:hypothetical protein
LPECGNWLMILSRVSASQSNYSGSMYIFEAKALS